MNLRSFSRSTLQAALAAAALSMLAGANGDGCSGDPVEPPPPPDACAEGFHIEQICQPMCDIAFSAAGEPLPSYGCDALSCEDTCVPDDPCPAGTYGQWICYGGGEDEPGDPRPAEMACAEGDPDCGGGGGGCFLECIPVDVCGPGFHEEWICHDEDGYPKPLPAEEDGSGDRDGGAAPPEECWSTCVPDGCPPGTIEQVTCEDVYCEDGAACEPPCWTECVPEPVCPEGQHPEEICELHDSCDEPVCKIVCVDDCGLECDPTLACGDALTCVGGLLYPSTCGPDNCDEPIGLCGDDCDPNLACIEVLSCFDGLLYPSGCGPKNCDLPIGACGEDAP